MNLIVAVFDSGSGKIESVVSGSPEFIKKQGNFIECDSDVSDTTHYVSGGKVKKKTAFTYQVKLQGLMLTIEGLPVNTMITVGAYSVLTDNKPTVIEFDIPGTYTVTLNGLIGYLEEDLEVTVGDA
jgi:hypothetical protein